MEKIEKQGTGKQGVEIKHPMSRRQEQLCYDLWKEINKGEIWIKLFSGQ